MERCVSKEIVLYNKDKEMHKIQLIIKRLIDICGSIVGIFLLIPITIFVIFLNMIFGDKGPVFYSHTRIGKNGKHFKMFKFRTMCMDADKKLEQILKNNESMRFEWEENRKLQNDPRITRVGRFIRKNSIYIGK